MTTLTCAHLLKSGDQCGVQASARCGECEVSMCSGHRSFEPYPSTYYCTLHDVTAKRAELHERVAEVGGFLGSSSAEPNFTIYKAISFGSPKRTSLFGPKTTPLVLDTEVSSAWMVRAISAVPAGTWDALALRKNPTGLVNLLVYGDSGAAIVRQSLGVFENRANTLRLLETLDEFARARGVTN